MNSMCKIIRKGIVAGIIGLCTLSFAAGIGIQSTRETRKTLPFDLDALLQKTTAYCQRLEAAALDFVCREEIKETIDPTLDVMDPQDTSDDWTWISRRTYTAMLMPLRKIINFYVYDYQCVRSGRAICETRTLLEENGKEKREANAVLKTSVVVFGTALMAPVGLFGKRFKSDYDYSLVGHEMLDKTSVAVINARPKTGAPATSNLYGKAWIDSASGDILKVEWSDSRVGGFEIFEKRGRRYMRTPQLNIRSDFKIEKNGIRFPSRLVVEEAYLGRSGRATVRSKTEVTYKDFKFFTVEVEHN
jgi:hypothetical protein